LLVQEKRTKEKPFFKWAPKILGFFMDDHGTKLFPRASIILYGHAHSPLRKKIDPTMGFEDKC